jgi:hypothetical protein
LLVTTVTGALRYLSSTKRWQEKNAEWSRGGVLRTRLYVGSGEKITIFRW